MKARLSQVHWKLILKTAVVLYLVTFLLGLGVSLLLQVFQGRSHLEPQSVQAVPLITTALLVAVVTGYGAWRVASQVERAAALHGFLVGLVLAFLSLLLDLAFSRTLELVGLVLYALIVIAGSLGGILGSRR